MRRTYYSGAFLLPTLLLLLFTVAASVRAFEFFYDVSGTSTPLTIDTTKWDKAQSLELARKFTPANLQGADAELRKRTFGFDNPQGTGTEGDLKAYDDRLVELLKALDSRSTDARKAMATSGTAALTPAEENELDDAIGLIIAQYEIRSKGAGAAAPPEFATSAADGADIVTAIKRIFTEATEKTKFDQKAPTPANILVDVFSTDQAYELDRQREVRVERIPLNGLKAATHSAMHKLAAVFDNFIATSTTATPAITSEQKKTIQRVQAIEKDPTAIFTAATDADAVEKLYVEIRTEVPLYDKEATGAGATGNQMPKMRDSRFRQAIRALNEEFMKKIEPLTTPPFHIIPNPKSTLNDMIDMEAPETVPLKMFGYPVPAPGAPGNQPPTFDDLDQRYKQKFDKVNPVRKNPEGPAFNFWAKEVLKKLGSDFNQMFVAMPALASPVLPIAPFEQPMLGKMRDIEAPDPQLFGTPPVDIPTKLESAFETAKLKSGSLTQDQIRAALAGAKFDGMANRLDFDNELLGNEYLRLATSKVATEVTNPDSELTKAAEQMIWPATPPRANTLGLTGTFTIADVDTAFGELYAKLGFGNAKLDKFTNFLEVRQKFVEKMVRDYLHLAQSDSTMAPDVKLLKSLEELMDKTDDLKILDLGSPPAKTVDLDKQFANKLMKIESLMKSKLGPLKEFSIRVLPTIKQKITDAFDHLYEANPKPDEPKPPNDLRKELQKAEKGAKQLLLSITPGAAIVQKPLNEIETQYTTFVNNLRTLLEDKEMAKFLGLKKRAEESLNALNKAYLELLPAQVSSTLPPSVEAAVKNAKDILAMPSQEEMLGLASGAKPTTLAELDEVFQRRLNELNLADPDVAKLPALNTVIDELVLRALDNAYAMVGQQLLSKPPLSAALKAMENGLDDIEKLGSKTPFNKAEGLAMDKRYFELASKLLAAQVLEHAGLLDRAKRVLKKLNTAYDRVVTRNSATFFDIAVPTAKTLHDQLKTATGKRDAELFVAKDIVALSKEYVSQKEILRQAAVDPKLNVYPGLKLRAKAEKERLSRAFFPAASALSISDTKVKKAVDKANRIIGIAKYEDILGGKLDSNSHLEDIDKAYLEIFMNTLNLEEDPLTSADYIGLNQALDIVVLTKMGNAYRNLTESVLMKVNNQKLDPAELGMFKTLDLVESATNDVETLTDADKFTDKTTLQQLDDFYRIRFLAIRNGRNGQLAALEGLVKRSKRAKQKMNVAYDALTDLTKAPNGQRLTPQKALDLQKLIKELEKPEHTADPKALFGFSRTVDISDIDKLEAEFMNKKKPVMDLLADKSFTLPGLRLRASEAIERLKALKDQIYEEDFFSSDEEKKAWHLVVEVENAHANAFQIFGLTKDTLTQAALDKKKKELDDILKLTLFDDPGMQKLKDRAEAAQRAIRAAFDQLKALIPGLRPAPGPGGPGQRPPGPTPIEQRNLDMEFDNNPPIVEPANQCVDLARECRLELCKLRGYVVAMHKNCRRTCSVCFPAGQPCVDKNRFDCPTWKAQGFCTSKVYSKGMKMRECAATCGLCPLAAGRR